MSEMSTVTQTQDIEREQRRKFWREKNLGALLWVLPAVAIVALFTIYPVGRSVDLALHRNVLTRPNSHPYVGLENFEDVVQNESLHRSIVVTVRFTILSVVGTAVLGIGIGLLMNQPFFGAKVLQVLILIPWAIPPVMAGIMWLWMFRRDIGTINGALYSLGLIDSARPFMATHATITVLIARLWKDVPLAAILSLATYQVIPQDLYDAAHIDGAGAWQRFTSITIPFLKPTLMVILIVETIISFVTFDLIAVMTGGGPADETRFIAWFTFQEIFTNGNLGRGAALAFLIALVTLVLALAYFFALGQRGIYETD